MEMEARPLCLRAAPLCKTQTWNGLGRWSLEKYTARFSVGAGALALDTTSLSAMRSFVMYMFLLTGSMNLQSFYVSKEPAVALRFPYHEAGLSDRQAAAHLLNRFSYGATPADVDAAVRMGIE